MARRQAPKHEKNYLIHYEPPGTPWGANGLVVCYDTKLVSKVTDHKRPSLAELEQGRYAFLDSDGRVVRGFLIEKSKDGAIIEIEQTGMDAKGEWGTRKVLRRVKPTQVLATEADYDARPLVRSGLMGGKVLGLGYVPGTEPADWMKVGMTTADRNRPESPML